VQHKTVEISSTEAQNNFGRILGRVARNETVVIRKRDVREAVIISFERYEALTQMESPVLNTLDEEFDALLASMQTPSARAAAQKAFEATPEELGEAAVLLARQSAK
jgi:prevent-host-death family protein